MKFLLENYKMPQKYCFLCVFNCIIAILLLNKYLVGCWRPGISMPSMQYHWEFLQYQDDLKKKK